MIFKRERKEKLKNDVMIKSSAYNLLIEQKVHSLPVPTPQDKTIIVFPMQFLEKPPIYCDIYKYDGVLMHLNSDNRKRYVLMYNDVLSEEKQDWTVFKLLYYVKSGIADDYPGMYINSDILPDSEIFAAHYACPDIVLEVCNILKSEDIVRYCHVPFDAAHRKSKYLKTGNTHFPFTTLENIILNNFSAFIKRFE